MRMILNTVIALTLAGVLAGVLYMRGNVRDQQDAMEQTLVAVQDFQRQVHLQAAFLNESGGQLTYPETVDPTWFGDLLPRNALLPVNHAWLEIANPDEATLKHPMRRTSHGPDVASFWYNPNNGTVRGRVPAGITDAKALEMYNYINSCDLPDLFEQSNP